ncbi:hypothetical protein O181_118001, partial [Austropuccinia psidii MF-1]|nr:hypothetical protein [Austropuccinia psidii MF-1]
SIYFSRIPPMKLFCSPIINKPPMVVSNHVHPPLSLCHILNSLLAFLIVQYYLILINCSTSPIIPQMPYLDVEMRGRLVGMRQAGLSFRAIAQLNDLPLTTVYKTFQKYQNIGTVTTQKKTGRPTKLNEHDRRQLSWIITRCRRLTVAQKPCLRPQDFQCWLAFAQAHRHWTINEWAKVIWTDKSAFELGKRVDQVRVWRTASEKWLLENVAHNRFLGWSHEFTRNGLTSLPPCSSPLHRANGASPVDTRSTSPPANGRQCTNPYSRFQQSMARAKWDTQDGLAGTFARPQSD